MQLDSKNVLSFMAITGFVVLVIIFLIFGETAAFRFAGVLSIAHAIYIFIARSFPIGIQGYPPFFFLTGLSAIFIGSILAILGVLLIIYPTEVTNAVLTFSHKH